RNTAGKSERQIRRDLNNRLRRLEYGAANDNLLKNPGEATCGQRAKRALILMMLTALVPGGAQSVTGKHRLGRIGLAVTLSNWTSVILAISGLPLRRDVKASLARS